MNPTILHKARKAAGLSSAEAGALVYVTRKTIESWEKGERTLGRSALSKVELLMHKLPIMALTKGHEIVFIRDYKDQIIDCIAKDALYELTGENNFDLVYSLAVDRETGRPRLDRTVFDINFNREAWAVMSKWKQLK